MADSYRIRRIILTVFIFVGFCYLIVVNTPNQTETSVAKNSSVKTSVTGLAIDELAKLPVKGRAPKTGYTREQFGADWNMTNGCNTRNIILNRDMTNVMVDESCNVTNGTLNDPYSGKIIVFARGSDSSSAVQIDHVVALSDAWQKGAQQMTQSERVTLANDPLELLAVDGPTNMQKGDGDAATWLPPNKSFRCQYVARQIAVKIRYKLWVTTAEHDAMTSILDKCPGMVLPSP